MERLKGKVSIITGGSKGIGAAMVRRFGAEGAIVYNLDIDETAGFALQEQLAAENIRGHFITCNLGDEGETSNAINRIFQSEGRIDHLVNNAGIAHVGNVENTTIEDMDRIYQVNIKGVFHCIKFVIPHMRKNGGGVILNMSSIAAVVGLQDRFAYSMSKGAVLTMTYSVAKDYVRENIRCNAIAPARVHTPFVEGYLQKNYPGQEEEMYKKLEATQPIGRMGRPEEIAALAAYLCSDEASFITGSVYPIDGGLITLNT